jgi:hypothetical protein
MLCWSLGLLLNTVPVKLQVPKHGDELYANFRAPLHTWVLFNAESCCNPLLRALGEVTRTHSGCQQSRELAASQLRIKDGPAVYRQCGRPGTSGVRAASQRHTGGAPASIRKGWSGHSPWVRRACNMH